MRTSDPRAVVLDTIETDKPAGGVRLVTSLTPAWASAYASVVRAAPVGVAGHGVLIGAGGLAHARRRWDRAVRTLLAGETEIAAVRSDVLDCYGSIGPRAVGTALRDVGVDRGVVAAIVDVLRSLRRAGPPGLPVGPAPSAVLADAVLAVGDRAVMRAGGRIVRWVDDVLILADDDVSTLRAFDAWRRALGALGLTPHEGKTAVGPAASLVPVLGSGYGQPPHGMMRPR